MIVHFETPTHDDNRALEAIEMSSPPRIGEMVVFRGDEYGGRRQFGGDTATLFKVIDVVWEIDVVKGEKADASCTVIVELHEQDEQRAVFVPRCECAPDQRVLDEKKSKDLCDNCNCLAWWNK